MIAIIYLTHCPSLEVYLTVSTDSIPAAAAPSDLTMDDLARVLFGHAAFQYLNAACELGLLDLLLDDPKLTKPEIDLRLGLDERANDILLLGCTALGITKKSDGRYETAQVLTDMQEGGDLQRLKDTVAFEQYIVYEGQLDFTESLRRNRNVGLRRVRGTGANLYHRLSENPELERVFYTYMRSWSELANRELTRELDLSGAKHLLDCGGGDAVNAIALAKANPHLQVTVMEIPATARITKRRIADEGLSGQIDVVAGDMFNDPFPSQCDVILFAHQMVIWTLEENTHLMRRAYQALPDGGQLVITNSMSNDEGDGPTVAALDSVYFASLPSEGGMIYSWEQHENCMREAGFKNIRRKQFSGWTPHGMITGQRS
ncbi:methyltransferase [Micromonospora craniellae]|nr:methyltransferase [Micromonospora craniellae]